MTVTASRSFPIPEVGATVAPLRQFLSLQRLIMVSGANRDFAMTHVDNESARAGGAPAAYADVMYVFTMIDRLILEWTGPAGVLRRIGPVKLKNFIACGTELVVEGTVTGVRPADGPRGRQGVEIEVDVRLSQGTSIGAEGRATAWVPTDGVRQS